MLSNDKVVNNMLAVPIRAALVSYCFYCESSGCTLICLVGQQADGLVLTCINIWMK